MHEDKRYYPDAEDVYGGEVEVVVQEEDTQMLSEPIIAPVDRKAYQMREKQVPNTSYSKQYMLQLMDEPEFVRNIAVVGHLHHGKTSLCDMLIEQTHSLDFSHFSKKTKQCKLTKYLDIHYLERDRGMSIKAQPITLCLPNSNGKHYVMNVIDTPGHVDFIDEASASIRISDGALLVVDVVEGVLINTERLIKEMLKSAVPFVLVINKIDRLILEMKLPPSDAYFKIRHVIEEVNAHIRSCTSTKDFEVFKVSPELGNVCFASNMYGFIFSLNSFSEYYQKLWKSPRMDTNSLAVRLWGDVFYSTSKNAFVTSSKNTKLLPRSFVHFILEPLYKIFSHTISREREELKEFLSKLGIRANSNLPNIDVKPLMRETCRLFFGDTSPLINVIVTYIPDPVKNAHKKTNTLYTGDMSSEVGTALQKCSSTQSLAIDIVKLYPKESGSGFLAFGRVYSGTISKGKDVVVLDSSATGREDAVTCKVEGLFLYCSRYQIEVANVKCGNWALIDLSCELRSSAFAIVDCDFTFSSPFKDVKLPAQSVVKVAAEPFSPSDLPKMLQSLRSVNLTYLSLNIKIEESGEHVLRGPGETYLDCALHDLRKVFGDIEIRLSDPSVTFCETVLETSCIKCYADTPNKKNRLTMISEPLEKSVIEGLESGVIASSISKSALQDSFKLNYGWDLMAARGIWTFGPLGHEHNVLLDDTLPTETDKNLLQTCKDSIVQGFHWATREGPLCDEPIRNVKFRILDAVLAPEAVYRGGGQIIPSARRVTYSSFLTAMPRLLEPVNYLEIESPSECIPAIHTLLSRRRGHITQDVPRPGSLFCTVKAFVPTIDSFGFETDLRTYSRGQAFCQQTFDHWQIVPGDPLDKSVKLRPLEPSPPQYLARDFMLKTRRRKGLGDDVSVTKFFDDSLLFDLAKSDILLGTSLI